MIALHYLDGYGSDPFYVDPDDISTVEPTRSSYNWNAARVTLKDGRRFEVNESVSDVLRMRAATRAGQVETEE